MRDDKHDGDTDNLQCLCVCMYACVSVHTMLKHSMNIELYDLRHLMFLNSAGSNFAEPESQSIN